MKPLHEQIADIAAKQELIDAKLDRILDILIPPPVPQSDAKTPEELKADIEKMVDDAFKKAENTVVIEAQV